MRDLRASIVILVLFVAGLKACDAFYDEGARFSNALGAFGSAFAKSNRQEDVFVYTPKYGVDQDYSVRISQRAATVWVERGRSGTGYAFSRSVDAPVSLAIRKRGAPVRVSLAKRDGVVVAIAIE